MKEYIFSISDDNITISGWGRTSFDQASNNFQIHLTMYVQDCVAIQKWIRLIGHTVTVSR